MATVLDSDHSGSLSLDEVEFACKKLQVMSGNQKTARRRFDFPHWRIPRASSRGQMPSTYAKRVFDRLDRYHDGKVNLSEFAQFLHESEVRWSVVRGARDSVEDPPYPQTLSSDCRPQAELRTLFMRIDSDGNGIVSRAELVAFLDHK
jgi:Ca2+-binding EF-hand superfamily protein